MGRCSSSISATLRRISLLVLALVFTLSSAPIVAAEEYGFTEPPEITNREKAHRNVIFTGEGNGEQEETCSEDDSSVTLTGSENLEKVFNYMKGRGLSPEQAAGVVGNISVESGGNPINAQVGPDTKDPTQFGTEVGVGRAWGLIQWDAGGRSVEYAKQANITTPIYELATQLELVWWHMNNTSPTSAQNMYKDYKNITDVAAATTFYEEKMEGAGTPHMETRIERAKEALRKYGGGSSSTSPVATDSPSGCGSDGGIASANGFTFPLVTTQKAITQNKPYPWCYAKLINCHHDYKAADIMISTGTTIIAAKSGKVQNVNKGNQHPNNVTISTDDGKGINYYTHMGANTAAVREGQHVDAGDVLGKVGTSEDAMGTDPHLHFDMLPPKYKYRPSCSGAGCTSFPFIEVQPALTETFKMLPPG